jgi:hypothetical protein
VHTLDRTVLVEEEEEEVRSSSSRGRACIIFIVIINMYLFSAECGVSALNVMFQRWGHLQAVEGVESIGAFPEANPWRFQSLW